ncbi:heavy metal sensor histidine kinase [Sulfuriflexus sp.]|uniref:heavy metal sensor histidine kinase n=1 Tax=Sulfuriflexus sp. TaxID=2015443 RepID=UPI0028CC2431|nr:heavy metal sensor histidine kinase [Sulfuriflexus sp.]MDT8403204.1 heavy metal sensor histidine kinase [Sulfuriflexus sp.]
MRQPPSLTLRLSLLFGISTFIVFFVFGWFIEDSIKRHFSEEDVSELEIVAQAIEKALLVNSSENDPASLERRFNDILVGHHRASLHIVDTCGRTIYNSIGTDSTALILPIKNSNSSSVRVWNNGEHTFRVLTRHLRGNTLTSDQVYTIVIAVPIDYHMRFLDDFRYTLWFMISSGIVITSLMGWIAVRQGHAPLRNIVTQIRQISANELNTRLSPDTVPGELTDLAISFNEMLGRMEDSFLRLSNFSADIAHELRTPVTSLMTQTQVALSQTRTINEYRETLCSNIEEYERMAQMISEMLYLAQADNGLCKPNNADVDLAKEVHTLFDYYEAWAEERGVMLKFEGDVTVVGDKLMLRQAMNNLLTNAIRHTPRNGTVCIYLNQSSNGDVHIDVKNPGPDIESEHLPRLFDRFYRVDPSRQESGSGLGLAIVKSIIDAHDGKIEVTSSGGFTQFRIILPIPPAEIIS